MKQFVILDEREIWHAPACSAATEFGYEAKRIFRGTQMPVGALGFIRTHADQKALRVNQEDHEIMASRGVVIQDKAQVNVYENKTEQFHRWGRWMPETWVFTDLASALDMLGELPYPIVSKANEGASSVNVRILNNRAALERHVRDVFAGRVMVNACSGVLNRSKFAQTGYVFLQRFIPHTTTWRVNAIGNARAIFKRYCYRNKPVAQTGNVDPVMEIGDFESRLLEYSDAVFEAIGSKWCAIDVLYDQSQDQLRMLETSLAWPWPSPGACMEAPLFRDGKRSGYAWKGMWHSMFEQVGEGVWARPA